MNALVSSATPTCLKYHRIISMVLNSFTTTYSTNARTNSINNQVFLTPKKKDIVQWSLSQHNTAYSLVTEVEAEYRGRQTSSN